MRTQTEQPMS